MDKENDFMKYLKKSKYSIIIIIGVILFAFGERIISQSFSIDTELYIGEIGAAGRWNWWITLNRWGLVLLNKIFQMGSLPIFASNFLTVILIIAYSIGFNYLFYTYTKEEYKMINETRKILNKPNLPITATCVRVPVKNCHSESINVEFEKEIDIYDIKILLQNSPGIILVDDIENNHYPIATKADGSDDVYIGRIRRDFSVNNGINFWVVSDNLRKGAASNAVQILEKLIS